MKNRHIIVLFLGFVSQGVYGQTGINSYYFQLRDISSFQKDFPDARLQLSDIISRNSNLEDSFTILPASWYFSYNSAYPSGGYDSGLWQGKGLNSQVSSGFLIQSQYIDASFLPEINFSENASFALIDSLYGSVNEYGNEYSQIDLPQRFGDDPILDWNWGESLIRVKYKKLYLGVGTHNTWVGFSNYSPLLFSNQAEGYPKIEFGLYPVSTKIGDFEFRTWAGFLSESDYFDDDESNDTRIQTAFALAYRPSFIEGLTVGLNRAINSYAEDPDNDFFWELFDFSLTTGRYADDDSSNGVDAKDQRFSVTAEWRFQEPQFRIYGELARNDSFASITRTLQTPFQSCAYNWGIEKIFSLSGKNKLDFNFEAANTWESRDYHLNGTYRPGLFYSHGRISQGYTNNGQLLGSFIGSGSDYQTVRVLWFNEVQQSAGFRFQRKTRNDDYIYAQTPDGDKAEINVEHLYALFGNTRYKDLWIYAELGFGSNIARNYIKGNMVNNVFGLLELKYFF